MMEISRKKSFHFLAAYGVSCGSPCFNLSCTLSNGSEAWRARGRLRIKMTMILYRGQFVVYFVECSGLLANILIILPSFGPLGGPWASAGAPEWAQGPQESI